jgi:opacity protein-like surface antigen
MRKEMITLVCALSLFGSATGALAGAYGEAEQPEEMPAPAPAPAAAVTYEEEEDYAAPAFYLGAGGVFAIELFDNTGGFDFGNSNGFNVRAGYRVHRNVAVEALYERYTEFDSDPFGNIKAWSASANAKVYPITGRWQPYGLVGLGYLGAEAHDNNPLTGSPSDGGFMMRFGAGMDANITENWQIGPEVAYVLPFGDVDDLDMVTISGGVRYNFR